MDDKLEGWKRIAAFVGRDERTAKRWEASRGLPVHRLPGDQRSMVFAFASEVVAWQQSGVAAADELPAPEPAASPPTARHRRWSVAWFASGGAVFGALLLLVGLSSVRAPGVPPIPAAAQALQNQAVLDWSMRTPASLTAAVGEYRQAIRIAPGSADAYAGLARSYELLREFGAMPDAVAYPAAEAAARRAVLLNPQLADGHIALGFALFWWDWDRAGGEVELREAIRLAPNDAIAHHWLATMLEIDRRFPEALAEVRRAELLDPASRAARADEAAILSAAGQADAAVAIATHLVVADPSFVTPHGVLAAIACRRGDFATCAAEEATAASLRHSAADLSIAEATATGARTSGSDGAVTARVSVARALYHRGAIGPYTLARALALSGKGDAEAVALLELSKAHHEPAFMGTYVDLLFDSLRSRADFRTVLAAN